MTYSIIPNTKVQPDIAFIRLKPADKWLNLNSILFPKH